MSLATESIEIDDYLPSSGRQNLDLPWSKMGPGGSISVRYVARPAALTMLLGWGIRCSPAGCPEQPRLSSWAEYGVCPSLAGIQSSKKHPTGIFCGGATPVAGDGEVQDNAR